MSSSPPAVELLLWSDLLGPPTAATITAIERAFSYDGLGLLVVRGIPGFVEARAAALPFSHSFATLPEAVKQKYIHEPSFYSFGWSHGKEKFSGQPDFAKGSYYFNPIHDTPTSVPPASLPPTLLPFLHPNIWPTAEDCPGFEPAAKQLAGLMVSAGAELARHVDAYVAQHHAALSSTPIPPSQSLERIVRASCTHKARLLYYFPAASQGQPASEAEAAAAAAGAPPPSPWCGAHNDHGSLTALTSALFFDGATGATLPGGCPDPTAGLYIKTRAGHTVRAPIPADCLAFQIGECAQVMSGGALQATPHWVRAPAGEGCSGIARGTMAVFM